MSNQIITSPKSTDPLVADLETGFKWANSTITYYDTGLTGKFDAQIDYLMSQTNQVSQGNINLVRTGDPTQADITIAFVPTTPGGEQSDEVTDFANNKTYIYFNQSKFQTNGFKTTTTDIYGPGADCFLHEVGNAIFLKDNPALPSNLNNQEISLMNSQNYFSGQNNTAKAIEDGKWAPLDQMAIEDMYQPGASANPQTLLYQSGQGTNQMISQYNGIQGVFAPGADSQHEVYALINGNWTLNPDGSKYYGNGSNTVSPSAPAPTPAPAPAPPANPLTVTPSLIDPFTFSWLTPTDQQNQNLLQPQGILSGS